MFEDFEKDLSNASLRRAAKSLQEKKTGNKDETKIESRSGTPNKKKKSNVTPNQSKELKSRRSVRSSSIDGRIPSRESSIEGRRSSRGTSRRSSRATSVEDNNSSRATSRSSSVTRRSSSRNSQRPSSRNSVRSRNSSIGDIEETPVKRSRKDGDGFLESPKQLIRPSKLGSFGIMPGFNSTLASLSKSAPTFGKLPSLSSSSSSLFGASPADLIVEGKRQWKPSQKVQERINLCTVESSATSTTSDIKKSITQYADAISSKSTSKPNSANLSGARDEDEFADENHEKIQRILASQWDSRLRKVDNKFLKTSRLSSIEQQQQQQQKSSSIITSSKQPLLRESKLELNQGLLERMRKPSQQIQFYEAIQKSMQVPGKTPPKLLNSSTSINPGENSI